MGRTCKPWRCICIKGNWCRWRVPAKSSTRCAVVISRKEPCCAGCRRHRSGWLPRWRRLPTLSSVGRLQHGDETGIRIGGKLHWLHVNCTSWLTHLAWHPKRGRQAMDEIGIWPRFGGRAMHDRLSSSDKYAGAHSVGGAHLLRGCIYLAEQEQQAWAAEMADHLLAMHHAAHEWRLRGASSVPRMERDEWVVRYFEILASGYAAQPPPVQAEASKRRGRQKQSAAKNLLDDLLRRAD